MPFSKQPDQLPPTDEAQELRSIIDLGSIKTDEDSIPKIENPIYLASYNWLSRGQKTILIPGCPPRWVPPINPPLLKQDRGIFYRDKNASQYSKYPLEPGVRAIFEMNPDFKGQEIDIFACGNTMGSLLAFTMQRERTFRFSVQMVGSTLFLCRKANSPDDIIRDIKGYGHNFPEIYTVWDKDCVGSESHQRLISYQFGGMKYIIRSETDGYLPHMLDDDHPYKYLPKHDNFGKDLNTDFKDLTSIFQTFKKNLRVS